MADATSEGKEPPLRVAFHRRLKPEFRGARLASASRFQGERVIRLGGKDEVVIADRQALEAIAAG